MIEAGEVTRSEAERASQRLNVAHALLAKLATPFTVPKPLGQSAAAAAAASSSRAPHAPTPPPGVPSWYATQQAAAHWQQQATQAQAQEQATAAAQAAAQAASQARKQEEQREQQRWWQRWYHANFAARSGTAAATPPAAPPPAGASQAMGGEAAAATGKRNHGVEGAGSAEMDGARLPKAAKQAAQPEDKYQLFCASEKASVLEAGFSGNSVWSELGRRWRAFKKGRRQR